MFKSVICEKCNEKMPAKANYCMNCGSPVGKKLEEIKEEDRKRLEEEEKIKREREMIFQRMNRIGNVVMKSQIDSGMGDGGYLGSMTGMQGAMMKDFGSMNMGGDGFGSMNMGGGFGSMDMGGFGGSFDGSPSMNDRPAPQTEPKRAESGRDAMSEEQRRASEMRMMRQMEMMNQRRQSQMEQKKPNE